MFVVQQGLTVTEVKMDLMLLFLVLKLSSSSSLPSMGYEVDSAFKTNNFRSLAFFLQSPNFLEKELAAFLVTTFVLPPFLSGLVFCAC